MESKDVNKYAKAPVENFRYFLSVMAWLAVFFLGFLLLLVILILVLPEDPEWVEYCAEYYPGLSISACKTASGAN